MTEEQEPIGQREAPELARLLQEDRRLPVEDVAIPAPRRIVERPPLHSGPGQRLNLIRSSQEDRILGHPRPNKPLPPWHSPLRFPTACLDADRLVVVPDNYSV